MSSHVLSITGFLPASPLGKGERFEVRGSTVVLTSLNPHLTLSALRPVAIPGEADVARII